MTSSHRLKSGVSDTEILKKNQREPNGVEFIRYPQNPGLNKITSGKFIFQHTLAVIGFECYLTVDIHSDRKIINEYYTREQGDYDQEQVEILWAGVKT